MARLAPKDVWDLTTVAGGDHVLIALTVDECKALMRRVEVHGIRAIEHQAAEQIRLSLRDQKGVE